MEKVKIEDFGKLDLRVATVLDVAPHPNADRLYVLQLQVGSEKKQIVAGVRKFYGVDELRGRKIVIVNNLEPSVIRGVESNGMLLAASNAEKTALSLIGPERQLDDGARVG